jgi:multidrug efflux pump subunit AcrA (membrane-fusion protein)
MKNKIKKWRIPVIIAAVLCIAGIIVGLTLGLSGKDEAIAGETRTVTVGRGNLSIEISAAGNLALSRTEDLAFEVAGTVVEVLVSEGDTVTEGQELAKLDTTEWERQLKTLEKAVVTAQRNVAARENAVTDAERQITSLERQVTEKENAVARAERQVSSKEFAVKQAELAVQTANSTLNEISVVKEACDAVEQAELNMTIMKKLAAGDFGGWLIGNYDDLVMQMSMAEDDLAAAQEDYEDVLEGTGIRVTDDIALQLMESRLSIEQKQISVQDAQIAVSDAKLDVEDAKIAVEDAEYAVKEAILTLDNARYAVEDAKSTLEDAQSDLDEAKSLSPIITAPFDGFIPAISVEGGDEVLKGTVAMQIADSNKFKADITVSEMDISQITLGGEALIAVDSADGVILPAAVTYISPTATIQSGVVNYKVTVEVQSTSMAASQPSSATGNQTAASPSGMQGPVGQMASIVPDDFTLRQGLTVTVSLIVANQQNVVVAPYAAVTTERGQKYVQVVTAAGETEKRAVTIGITDYSYIEITDGLTEGEQIVVSQGSAAKSTSTTEEEQQQGNSIMMPNMGGGPPAGGPPGGQ